MELILLFFLLPILCKLVFKNIILFIENFPINQLSQPLNLFDGVPTMISIEKVVCLFLIMWSEMTKKTVIVPNSSQSLRNYPKMS